MLWLRIVSLFLLCQLLGFPGAKEKGCVFQANSCCGKKMSSHNPLSCCAVASSSCGLEREESLAKTAVRQL